MEPPRRCRSFLLCPLGHVPGEPGFPLVPGGGTGGSFPQPCWLWEAIPRSQLLTPIPVPSCARRQWALPGRPLAGVGSAGTASGSQPHAAPRGGAEGHLDALSGGAESSRALAAAADISTALGACLLAPSCPQPPAELLTPNSCSSSANGPAGGARGAAGPTGGLPPPGLSKVMPLRGRRGRTQPVSSRRQRVLWLSVLMCHTGATAQHGDLNLLGPNPVPPGPTFPS